MALHAPSGPCTTPWRTHVPSALSTLRPHSLTQVWSELDQVGVTDDEDDEGQDEDDDGAEPGARWRACMEVTG